METTNIRVRLSDWKRIKKYFPSYKGETAQAYFFRLAEHLKEAKR